MTAPHPAQLCAAAHAGRHELRGVDAGVCARAGAGDICVRRE